MCLLTVLWYYNNVDLLSTERSENDEMEW
jgi:hypothetical protein